MLISINGWHGIAYVYSQLDREAPFYHQSPFSKENRTSVTHHFMLYYKTFQIMYCHR